MRFGTFLAIYLSFLCNQVIAYFSSILVMRNKSIFCLCYYSICKLYCCLTIIYLQDGQCGVVGSVKEFVEVANMIEVADATRQNKNVC
jgi:hypothetical protein